MVETTKGKGYRQEQAQGKGRYNPWSENTWHGNDAGWTSQNTWGISSEDKGDGQRYYTSEQVVYIQSKK